MKKFQHLDKENDDSKGIFRFLVGFLVIVGLAGYSVQYLYKISDNIDVTRYESAIAEYRDNVNQIHIHWMWNGRPSQINLADANNEVKRSFLVNNSGWPMTEKMRRAEPGCRVLWDELQASVDLETESVLIQTGEEQGPFEGTYAERGVCQYYVADVPLFYYHLTHGVVNKGEYKD